MTAYLPVYAKGDTMNLDPSSTDDYCAGPAWQIPDELLQIAQEAGGEIIMQVLGIFQEDSRERLKELDLAIASKDPDAIRSQAHALKGSAGQIGALKLSRLCQGMEQLSRTGTMAEQKRLFAEIDTALRQVVKRISAATLPTIAAQLGNTP